ncbi:MAG TPA: FAD-binding oxidoreductase [Candidatus Acidoferrales bacterium]|nr:FAD-binding oxidoreductase [Candidatus Acidoferrales bacterium]
MPPSSDKFYSARIIERRDISDDLWVFRVDPGGEFHYRAGQYATLGIVTPEKHHERPYSIVSSPHEKYLEFFFELVLHGQVTPRFHKCRVGDEITLRKSAKGNFALDLSGKCAKHFLIATVTGVAPFVSYVRSLYHDWKNPGSSGAHRLYILEGASRSWEMGYSDELEKIAAGVSWLTYIPTVSRPWEDHGWSGETGRVDDLIRKYADMWNLAPGDTQVYLCGHPNMIENTRGIVRRRGWEEDAIRAEAYFVPPRHDYAAEAEN